MLPGIGATCKTRHEWLHTHKCAQFPTTLTQYCLHCTTVSHRWPSTGGGHRPHLDTPHHSTGPGQAAWVRGTRDWTGDWRVSRLGRIIGYSLWQKKAISLSHSHWSASEKDCAVRRWTASSEVIWVILSSNSWAFWLCLSSALTLSCTAALRGGKKWQSR